MYYVYILKLQAKSGRVTYYTGYTENIDRRLEEHRQGNTKSTRGRKIELHYLEEHKNKKYAMRREREIKKISKKEKIYLGVIQSGF